MIVVAAGNPFDGMRLHGPFEAYDEANDWAERNITDDWWSVIVEPLPASPDLTLCVSFEPQAIRDHYEADDPDPTEGLTDEQLRKVAEYCISADSLWSLFHQLLRDALAERVWE